MEKNSNKGAKTNAPVVSAPQTQETVISMPTTSATTENRISPAAVIKAATVSLKSMITKLSVNRPARTGGSGGRTAGIKELLFALFTVKYENWDAVAKYIANARLINTFPEGAEHTMQNRVMIFGNETTGFYEATYSEMLNWLTEQKIEHTVAANGLVSANGIFIEPKFPTKENAKGKTKFDEAAMPEGTKFASMRKNREMAIFYGKLAETATDEDLKAHYTEEATNYNNAPKYGGFVVATKENAQAVADTIRQFVALNPELSNPFGELEQWAPVFGQEVENLENTEWLNTAEYAAQQAALEVITADADVAA